MKRIIGILLIVLSMTACLCACNGGGNEKKDAYFVQFGEVSVYIDQDIQLILHDLGSWNTYDESPSCAFEGVDRVYGYGAFDIQTYPLDGIDYVYAIYLNDDTNATREGIAVGATRDQVVAVYGEADEESATYLRYVADGMTLSFLLKNGAVTNIQYVKNP